MSEIRYLLDENVNPVLRAALLRAEPDLVVWQVGMPGAPAFGKSLSVQKRRGNSFKLFPAQKKFGGAVAGAIVWGLMISVGLTEILGLI